MNNTEHSVLNRQIKESLNAVIWVIAISLGLNLAGYGIHLWIGTPFETLYLDPIPKLGGDFSIGILSQIGNLLWASAGAVFLLGGSLVRQRDRKSAWTRFLFASGALSLLLGLDDILLIHEQVMPVFFGIKEEPVLALYVLIVLVYYLCFFRRIQETDLILLGLIVLGFGLSLAIDQLPLHLHNQISAAEDVPKLMAIVGWLVYAVRTSSTAVLMEFEPAKYSEATNG